MRGGFVNCTVSEVQIFVLVVKHNGMEKHELSQESEHSNGTIHITQVLL